MGRGVRAVRRGEGGSVEVDGERPEGSRGKERAMRVEIVRERERKGRGRSGIRS